jgi:hypothetical protein
MHRKFFNIYIFRFILKYLENMLNHENVKLKVKKKLKILEEEALIHLFYQLTSNKLLNIIFIEKILKLINLIYNKTTW